LPSLQGAVLLVKTHPVAGLQVSVVHTLLSLQMMPVPAHTPAVHTSPLVQALPSLQTVPLATFVNTHPVAGAQVSAVQALLSLHTSAVPPHTPLVHTSPVVQALPSLQAVPLATGVNTQALVVRLQMSLVHTLPSLQSASPKQRGSWARTGAGASNSNPGTPTSQWRTRLLEGIGYSFP